MRKTALLIVMVLCLQLGGAALFLFGRASGTRAALEGLPLDDAWIHLVYARSFAQHGVFHYNPGQPETGMTSPLWVILVSLPLRLGAGPVLSAKMLSFVFSCLLAVFSYFLAARIGTETAGWLAAALVSIDPYLAMARVSGMEVPLFSTLMVTALWCYAAEHRTAAGLAAGFAVLARPEGLLLLGCLAVMEIRDLQSKGRGAVLARAPNMVRTLGPALLLYLPWVVYCLKVTGRPLPSTFYVKAHPAIYSPFTQAAKILAFLFWQPLLMSGVGALVLVFGMLQLWAKRRERPAAVILLVLPWLYLGAAALQLNLGTIAPASTVGSMFSYYFARYLAPSLPLLWICLAVGGGEIIGRLRPAAATAPGRQALWSIPRRRAAGFVLAALLVLACGLLVFRNVSLAKTYSLNCANILDMQVAAGRWLQARTDAGTKVAVDDAGAIRYFSGRFTIDLHGLNFHLLVDRSNLENVIRTLDPEYYAIFPSWHPNLSRAPFLAEVHRIRLEHNTICGADTLVIYRSTLR